MFKNTASQSVTLWAVDASTGLPKTGDSANMVFYVSKDDGSVTAISSASGVPTESDATNAKGDYKIAVSQTETNADKLRFTGKSSTSNVVVVPQTIYTVPANFSTLSVDSNGRVDVIKIAGTTQTAKDVGGAVPSAAAGASGGLLISGSNSGTTTLAALTVTGALIVSDGIAVTRSTSNASAITATGNGTGSGIVATSGSGATGDGIQSTAASTNGNGFVMTKTGSGLALKGATTDLTLAKTTNITGFNDIAATAIVSSGAITTSGGAVSTVTTVTNQLTTAQVATGVWQDATAGDFTAANSIGKSVMNGVSLGTGLTIAAVSGAVGSVTGAVGSVTGSVGSVVGAVGSVTGNVGGNVTGTTGDFTASLTESYAADGVAFTPSQALYMIWSFLAEKNISGTTLTAKKIDGSTNSMTFTLDAATPSAITRAT